MRDEILDDDFELAVAEGSAYRTLYVRKVSEMLHEPDPEAAARAMRLRAVNGDPAAQLVWAHMLLDGHGVARDAEAAFRWFAVAARSGDADALNMVGRCYELAWGVAHDAAEAARWYGKAAAKGHARGEFNLAALLVQGNGVGPDPRAALTLLARSARRGNPKAMNMIGRYREEGHGRAPKPRSAAFWYRHAAKGGCFRGQFHHGRFLLASGKTGDGLHWLRASLLHAPRDFRREAAEILSRHELAPVRELGHEVLAGERGAPP